MKTNWYRENYGKIIFWVILPLFIGMWIKKLCAHVDLIDPGLIEWHGHDGFESKYEENCRNLTGPQYEEPHNEESHREMNDVSQWLSGDIKC